MNVAKQYTTKIERASFNERLISWFVIASIATMITGDIIIWESWRAE